jgi:hypothetical protein
MFLPEFAPRAKVKHLPGEWQPSTLSFPSLILRFEMPLLRREDENRRTTSPQLDLQRVYLLGNRPMADRL